MDASGELSPDPADQSFVPTGTGAVSPIHLGIPGRARFRVAGLHRAPALQARLERGLLALPGIRSAEASPRTGNLLLQFDASLELATVIRRAEALVRGETGPEEVGPDAPGTPQWHGMSADSVAAGLGSSVSTGLTAAAAGERLAEGGPNLLPLPPARSGLDMLLGQFTSLPVGLLAAAAAISVATGGIFEAAAILGVVGLNAAIGYTVESRSARTIRSLAAPGDSAALLVRDGARIEVPVEAVVPGDLLVLRRGTVVPADARLVAAQDLTVGEAMLTGESQPVTKAAEKLLDAAMPLADRANMVYRGTVVTGGGGLAIAVATGPQTEVGRIQRLAGEAATPETPMQRQLDEVGRQLVWLSLGVCGVVFGTGLLRGFGLLQMFRSSVSLAVAAVPEGLPAIATTTLALGIEKMRRHEVLVRRLDAVETLAAVQVMCFDKTGTLTLNRMSVAEISCGDGEASLRTDARGRLPEGAAPGFGSTGEDEVGWLLRIGILCSETQIEPGTPPVLNGSATENALVQLALDAGLDPLPLRREFPRLAIQHRSESYRFMASTHAAVEGHRFIAVKGSPEEVLGLCGWILQDGERRAITAADRKAIHRRNAAMAGEALRVLGFAFRQLDSDAPQGNGSLVRDLTWVGLAGMADPVRPGTRELMRRLHRAGIHTLMMTGDQVPTARAVARRLGLAANGELEVFDLAGMSGLPQEHLADAARRAHVFARVSPAQKLEVIRALQQAGMVVAMVGDGINDSPALKAADVGIAMGRDGAEAARDVADVVLRTDDLEALLLAVERGRGTYANVRKAIRYLLATNLSEIGVVLAATAAGFGDPLTVPQLLWINLVSDVAPAIGLALEPPSPGLMQQPPRPADEAILRGGDFRTMAAQGGVITGSALAALGFGVLRHGVSPTARTMAFSSLVTAQLLHALNCRAGSNGEAGPLPPNRALTGALAVSFGLQGAAWLVPGLRSFLGLAPLGPLDAAVTIGAGVLPYLAGRARAPRHRLARLHPV